MDRFIVVEIHPRAGVCWRESDILFGLRLKRCVSVLGFQISLFPTLIFPVENAHSPFQGQGYNFPYHPPFITVFVVVSFSWVYMYVCVCVFCFLMFFVFYILTLNIKYHNGTFFLSLSRAPLGVLFCFIQRSSVFTKI